MLSPAWNPPCFGAGRRIKGLPPPPGAASQRGHRTWMWMRWEDGLSITWRAVVAGLEAATAMCALLNLAYFLHRVISVDSPTRRAAALVLMLGVMKAAEDLPQETLDALLDELEFVDEHPHRIRRQRKRRRPHGHV